MENENKEKVILTDEELKEVAGAGTLDFIKSCLAISDRQSCEYRNLCKWDENQNKCLSKF
jgi:hypothetical protein